MAKIKGIHHVAIKSNGLEEFEKLVHFYRDILELPVLRAWGEGMEQGMMLDTGAGILEVFPNAEDRPGQGVLRHLALATDDVDGCIAAVHAEGYEITIEPKDINIGGIFPARIAFCIGPIGEEVEFFCEK
ncbi:MAG: VOC family protein [Clostridia bacterium]|nr:VOC family protein [Clostridia bacterium]